MRNWIWAWIALAFPAVTRAAAYDVESHTEAQVYALAVRNPDSGIALQRRRLVQVLDLAGFDWCRARTPDWPCGSASTPTSR